MNKTNEDFNYQPVTCLYSIGRDKVDGRNKNEYLRYLSALLKQYPHTIVFHDGSAKQLIKGNSLAVFVEIDLSDLPLHKYEEEIKKILERKNSKKSGGDLVFKLLDYGIIINSKTFFLDQASHISGKDFLVWIDAGISRFFPDFDLSALVPNQIQLDNKYDYIFQIDIKNWFRNYKFFSIPYNWIRIGSSQRVLSGGIFVCRRRVAGDLNKKFFDAVTNSIVTSKWDTEQIFFFKIMYTLQVHYLIQRRSTVVNLIPFKFSKLKILTSSLISFFIRDNLIDSASKHKKIELN